MATVPWWNAYQVEPGNIKNLENLPEVPNPYARDEQGNPGISTIWSASQGETAHGPEVIYPQVVNGVALDPSTNAAWEHYKQTGQHLGKYSTIPAAEAAAQQLHLEQQKIGELRRQAKGKGQKKALEKL